MLQVLVLPDEEILFADDGVAVGASILDQELLLEYLLLGLVVQQMILQQLVVNARVLQARDVLDAELNGAIHRIFLLLVKEIVNLRHFEQRLPPILTNAYLLLLLAMTLNTVLEQPLPEVLVQEHAHTILDVIRHEKLIDARLHEPLNLINFVVHLQHAILSIFEAASTYSWRTFHVFEMPRHIRRSSIIERHPRIA